jgi:gamma-glutamyl:cysteine ligase YbdK (ATP-grasp superfamily)
LKIAAAGAKPVKKVNLSLFEGFGIELEYMIVDAKTLAVKPIADKLLLAEGGSYDDLTRGPIGWSNELVNHVIELKTAGPAKTLAELPAAFQRDIGHINQLLAPMGAKLLPTGMHPLMNPTSETKLWPHEHSAIYNQFNQIFDCRGHGWSNLQSTHINLPFDGDAQLGQLHAALRMVLPLLPALAASSPIVEGKSNGIVDNRMQFYRNNALRVPSVSGMVVPEPAYTRKDYEMNILARIYQDLAPHDPENILQHEWVNARGVIARFERSTLEVRVLDVQECPSADIAIAAALVDVLRAMVAERWVDAAAQRAWRTQPLAALMRSVIAEGPKARIDDAAYLNAFGFKAGKAQVGELWQHLIETVWPASEKAADPFRPALQVILDQGPLSARIVRAAGKDMSREHLRTIYGELARCLLSNQQFGT